MCLVNNTLELLFQTWCNTMYYIKLLSYTIQILDMKGCICHFTKWQIHPLISRGTTCWRSYYSIILLVNGCVNIWFGLLYTGVQCNADIIENIFWERTKAEQNATVPCPGQLDKGMNATGDVSICQYSRHFNPWSAEIFLYKPWRAMHFFLIWNHHNVLVSSFCFTWMLMLWTYGHYK